MTAAVISQLGVDLLEMLVDRPRAETEDGALSLPSASLPQRNYALRVRGSRSQLGPVAIDGLAMVAR